MWKSIRIHCWNEVSASGLPSLSFMEDFGIAGSRCKAQASALMPVNDQSVNDVGNIVGRRMDPAKKSDVAAFV
jgi:hypothetical protein